MTVLNPVERRSVRAESGCLEWQGATARGYGHLYLDRKHWPAHRLNYVLRVGPVPEGLEIDHLCRNRRCVEPTHLEPVTHAENGRRGREANGPRETCKRGHAFDDKVQYGGARLCRECNKVRQRDYARRVTAARLAVEGVLHPSAGKPRIPLSERPTHPSWATRGLAGCSRCGTDRAAHKCRDLCGTCYNYHREQAS